MIQNDIQAIVLAAGHASRFGTGSNKQLAKICGQAMILYILKALQELSIPKTVVVGFQAQEVKAEIEHSKIKDINFAYQPKRSGTGDALMCSRELWNKDKILILNGDAPLINPELILDLYKAHKENNAALSICSTFVTDPKGYGRIVEEDGNVRIVEQKDCNAEQRKINKINPGIYLISKSLLSELIDQITPSPISGEIYVTEIVRLAGLKKEKIYTHPVNYEYVRGVDTLETLFEAEQIKRSELIKNFMAKGVRFTLPQSNHLDIDVKIGKGSVIGAGVHLLEKTEIGENVEVGAYSIIEKSKIENEVIIKSHSVISDSIIKNRAKVGPFAYLRNETILEENSSIGSFVEVKKSRLDSKSKAKHLAYIGDATIGKNVNIGAGVVIANYDGFAKHKTKIEDNVFIGSNSLLVAPLNIGKGAFVAGGSVINKDVDENDLAIGRARQENKKDYALKLREKNRTIIPAKIEDTKSLGCIEDKSISNHSEAIKKTEKII